jgi:hypothetical protein
MKIFFMRMSIYETFVLCEKEIRQRKSFSINVSNKNTEEALDLLCISFVSLSASDFLYTAKLFL